MSVLLLDLSFEQDERRKRKAKMQAAKLKKHMERVERKMAAVARDRAWAQRLAEEHGCMKDQMNLGDRTYMPWNKTLVQF